MDSDDDLFFDAVIFNNLYWNVSIVSCSDITKEVNTWKQINNRFLSNTPFINHINKNLNVEAVSLVQSLGSQLCW